MTDTHTFSTRLGDWENDGTAELTVTGPTIDDVFAAALTAILQVARGTEPGAAAPDSPSLSASIRGEGDDYAGAFIELAGDLLAQIDSNGTGLTGVRLDGMLATDSGGFSAWGYAVGEVGGGSPPVGLNLVDTPDITQEDGATQLVCRLRRS